jgi:DNA polymerase-3 subunit delta
MGRTLQSYKKLFASLKGDKPERLYVLYGPEEYLKKEFVAELIKTALSEQNRAFNLDICYGDDFERETFRDRVSSFPLFADRRMVILKKFEALSTANKDFVLEQIARVPDSLVVVVELLSEKFDSARLKSLKKTADAQGLAFCFKFLSEAETVDWVKNRLRKEGFTMEPDALDLLLESAGTHLIELTNELEKMILSAGDHKILTRAMVGAVVGKYRTENVFSFLDLVGKADGQTLVRTMNRIIDGGEEPVFLLGMLIRRIALLLQVKYVMVDKGRLSARQAADHLGPAVSPFYANILREQATRMDLDALHDFLANLQWADLKLKTSPLNARWILETCLLASLQRKRLALAIN